jgi:tRNA A37 threonylcarbamoyladenosine biosynthesis protein TsaE
MEPYFSGAIVFVEWPQAGEGVLPPAIAEVTIEHVDERRRRITIESSDPTLLAAMRAREC